MERKLITIILLFLSLSVFGQQYGEGRLPNWLTENKAHVGGGFVLGAVVYEGLRKKNPIKANIDPELFQRRESKNIGRTILGGVLFAGTIEATDYLKGGKPSFEDFGNTVGGFAIYAVGRFAITSIIQDRANWRSKGQRLRIGKKYLNNEEISDIYFTGTPSLQ